MDLDAIKADDPEAHAKIAAFVRQLHADRRLAEKLLDHGYGDGRTTEFAAQKWLNVWRSGKDLWRLKSWDLEDQGLKYRFLYVYLRHEARFVIMAIVKRRNFDYDDDKDPIRQRILASLESSYGLRR